MRAPGIAIALLACAAAGACRRAEPPAREAGAAEAGTPPPATAATERVQIGEGSFAYASQPSTELLALAPLASPATVRWAICANAPIQAVTYARRQPAQDSSSGRQTAANFAREGGDVYRATGRTADETCYLTSDSALASGATALPAAPDTACGTALVGAAAQAKGREVTRCVVLAGIAGPRVALVQFAFVDTTALASLVLATGSHLAWLDFPATYRGPDDDIWRADDGGQLDPGGFTILFVGERHGTPVIGVTWAGSEGGNAYLAVADSADALRVVTHQYRYWN